ncbi:MAG TPA: DUF222 domain-containing protein, partial [Actinomycetota bacterium]
MNDRNRRDALVSSMDAVQCRIGAAQLELLSLIAEGDAAEVWRGDGARDMAHWVCLRYGVSEWKARRWVAAGHALDELPAIAGALASGTLSLDKAVELVRFATPGTEARLLAWAQGVSAGRIRHRADLETRPVIEEATEAERARFVSWWYLDEGRRLGLEAELPAAQGAIVVRALEHLARQLPVMPGEDGPWAERARRADALVQLCCSASGSTGGAGTTLIVHAP